MPGYESQIAPRAGQPLPAASPEDYGAGLARSVGDFAQNLHRQKVVEHQVERRLNENAEWTDFQVKFAEAREAVAAEAREARKSDAPGHSTRIAATWQAREEALLGELNSDVVRQRARQSLASWGSAFRSGEADWETLRAGERATDNYRDQRDASANRVRRLDNAADYASELKIQREALDGLDISDKVREDLWRETEQGFAIAFIQGRTDEDPAGAMALIESGAFDEVLTPQQVDVLKNGVAVELRRAQAAAERVQSAEASALNQDMRTYRQEIQGGLDRTAEIATLRERAQALGRDDIVAELDNDAADSGYARQWEGAPPAQLEQRLASLNGKGNLTDAEARERKWIERTLPGITARYTADPVGFHARHGGQDAPPPLDLSDPASIDARSRWSRTNGVAEVLSSTEAAVWRKAYDEGRAGEEQVMALLNRFPPDQAARAARQIDPQDKTLPVIVTLPESYRAIARRGRAALTSNRRLLSDQMKEDLDLEEGVAGVLAQANQALRSVEPGQRDAIITTARHITAGYVDRDGAGFTPKLLRDAVNLSLGATFRNGVWRGGLADWGESTFVLPNGMSAAEFRQAALDGAANGTTKPVNPDGSPANIQRGVFPVAVGGGWYEFHTAEGRKLRGTDGGVWRMQPRLKR